MPRHIRSFCLVLAFPALLSHSGLTQDSSTITVHATDALAAEAGSDSGTFTIRRAGGTNFSQLIFYELSGTASNGVDYQQVGGTVQMPAGALAVSLTVNPIDDSFREDTETVLVRIIPSPLDCATCGYDIGKPDVAEIFIDDNDTDPRSGLYRINSGRYAACCGFAGDLGYNLPAPRQSFIRLEIDPQSGATMTFLGDDAQTIFSVVPCPSSEPAFFSFSHGLVFSNWIAFHVDPGPRSYWNYTASNSPNMLRVDGALRLLQLSCADVPDRFGHSNVVATLLPQAPLIGDLQRQGSALSFRFIGEPPYDYFVEYAGSLPAPSWLSLTNFRAKTAAIQAVVTDALTNSSARFYRIRKQPCFCRTEDAGGP